MAANESFPMAHHDVRIQRDTQLVKRDGAFSTERTTFGVEKHAGGAVVELNKQDDQAGRMYPKYGIRLWLTDDELEHIAESLGWVRR